MSTSTKKVTTKKVPAKKAAPVKRATKKATTAKPVPTNKRKPAAPYVSKKILNITSKKSGKKTIHTFNGYNVDYTVTQTDNGFSVKSSDGVNTPELTNAELAKRGIMWSKFLNEIKAA